MADATRLSHSSIPHRYNVLVSHGATKHIPSGAEPPKERVLPSLRCWFSRLVCLFTDCCDDSVADLSAVAVQDDAQ